MPDHRAVRPEHDRIPERLDAVSRIDLDGTYVGRRVERSVDTCIHIPTSFLAA